jgi:hypothetical protein
MLLAFIVFGSIASALLGLLFWGVIAWLGAKGASNALNGSMDPQFSALLGQVNTLIAQAQAAPGQALPRHLQGQFSAKLFEAQQRMRELDRLNQQRHEVFVSGMLSDATAAGLDVSGWRF